VLLGFIILGEGGRIRAGWSGLCLHQDTELGGFDGGGGGGNGQGNDDSGDYGKEQPAMIENGGCRFPGIHVEQEKRAELIANHTTLAGRRP